MRPIKFRAWDKVTQSMRYGAERSLTMCLMNPDDFELMQYTGLKDKNGVEIYEGDIVEFKDFRDIITAEVMWHSSRWAYRPKDWIMPYPAYEVGGNLKVIGNIYENKELLK